MTAFTNFVLNIHDNNSLVMENLGKLAAKIAYYNFEWRFMTLVIFETTRSLACVEAFLYSYNKPVILNFGDFKQHNRLQITQFVVFGHDSNELAHIIAYLARSQYNVSARIIIVCANDDYNRCDQDEVFQAISTAFMVNSIFLRPTKGTNIPTSLTYYPMKPNKCTNKRPEEIYIDLKCSNHSCRTAFPEKLNNFYRCALYISTIHQPPFMFLQNDFEEPYGADGDIIKLVAIILNATLRMKLPIDKTEWGHSVDNNWTGSLGDVFNKQVHASMASVPLSPSKNGNFQISFPYYSMEIVWTTRIPDLKPSWEKLFHPWKFNARIALFAVFIGITIVDACLKTKFWNKIRKPLNITRSKTNLLFKSLIIFLGLPVLSLPSKAALKAIVWNFIWFSLLIRSAYQATLFNTLKTNYYNDPFNNIKDVIRQGYSYGGQNSLREYYSEEEDIFAKWTVVRSIHIYDVLEKLMSGNTDFAIALNKASILHHLSNSSGTKHLQIIPEQIVTSPTVMYFKKFSPYVPAINKVLRVLVEAGFADMLYARYLDQAYYLFEHPQEYSTAPLDFGHFATCFMFLAAGWFISALYFAVEYFCKPTRELIYN